MISNGTNRFNFLHIWSVIFIVLGNFGNFALARSSFSGNGADNLPPESQSAWFYGEREIRYCYQVGVGFGVGRERIEKDLASAFNVWQSYIVQKKINDPKYNPYLSRNRPIPALSSRSRLMSQCDGSEDLTFYLGLKNEITETYRNKDAKTSAFAYLTDFDPVAKRGKGFVWVAAEGELSSTEGFRSPYWQNLHSFHGLLLHEIGHIYGNAHTDETVMQPNFGKLLAENAIKEFEGESSPWPEFPMYSYESMMTHIDWTKELFTCRSCQAMVPGHVYPIDESEGYPGQHPFEKIMGRKPIGKLGGRLEIRDAGSGNPNERLFFTLWDERSSQTFEIAFGVSNMELSSSQTFKRAWKDSGSSKFYVESSKSQHFSQFARIRGAAGADVTLTVNRNTSFSPVVINVVSGIHGTFGLFYAYPFQK